MRRKYSYTKYIKHALMHPWHVVLLAGATVFGVANWNIYIFLTVFALFELILFAVVMNLKAFINYVDDRLSGVEKAKASEKRAAILLKMPDNYRRDFLRLEALVDAMQERLTNYPTIAITIAGECRELLAQYIGLSIRSHVSVPEILGRKAKVQQQIVNLSHNRNAEDLLVEKRIAIAHKRVESFDRTIVALSDIDAQLSAISEMIELKTEQPILPGDAIAPAHIRIDDSIIDELSEFSYAEEIDMDVMQLGRAGR